MEVYSASCVKVELHRFARLGCQGCGCVVWFILAVILFVGYLPTWSDKSRQKATAAEQFPNGIDLYYGIQWWARGNVLHPVINMTTGLGQGPSKYFDPRKPTVIYSHGWQDGGVTGSGLERLTSHTGVHMADLWIDQGWNVGSFYWTQFADEGDVTAAEDKIWETCLEPGACFPISMMRWKNREGKSQAWKGGARKSVGQIFYDSVVASLANADTSAGSNFSLRLVGHSLGGNNVMAAGYKLAAAADRGDIPSFFKPDRIDMLDPFWSPVHEAAVLSRMYNLHFTHRVAVTVSSGSAFSSPRSYSQDLQVCGTGECAASFSQISPAYVNPLGTAWLAGAGYPLVHMAAKATYFLTIDPNDPNAKQGPSAQTASKVLDEFRASGKFWRQVGGSHTETILDDKYEAVDWNGSSIAGVDAAEWLYTFVTLTIMVWTLTGFMGLCCCHYSVKHVTRRLRNVTNDDARQPLNEAAFTHNREARPDVDAEAPPGISSVTSAAISLAQRGADQDDATGV